MSNRPRRARTFVFGVCHQPRALFVEVIVPRLLSFVNEVLSCLGRFLQGFLVRLGRCFIEVCPTASGVFYKAERPPWRVFYEVVAHRLSGVFNEGSPPWERLIVEVVPSPRAFLTRFSSPSTG